MNICDDLNKVRVKNYIPCEPDIKEIMRYAGGEGLENTISECLAEASDVLAYKVCFTLVECSASGDEVSLGKIKIKSHSLGRNLDGCRYAVIFAATAGVGIDRLIAKYSRLSPVKALCMQAIGAERAEALCNEAEKDIASEWINSDEPKGKRFSRPRFSPGYGDLPLDVQKQIFDLLEPYAKIGLSLGDSLMMSPSKSVTAIIGLGETSHR